MLQIEEASFPLVEPLPGEPDAARLFEILCRHPKCLYLDSAQREPHLGRYSFLAVDPVMWIESPADGSDALAHLAGVMRTWQGRVVPDLPPFQGGIAGLFGYGLTHSLERVPQCRWDEFRHPAIAVGCYDVVIAIDHELRQGWIISQGLPEHDPVRRQQRAQARMQQMQQWLAAGPVHRDTARPLQVPPLPREQLAPQYAVSRRPHLTSNLSPDQYCAMVQRGIDYIHAGDVFQVNLSQRLLHPAQDDAVSLYLRMRQRNPAPFAAYIDGGPWQILSSSPERFLRVSAGHVEARPIKGTRPRTSQPVADLFSASALRDSEKDRAENVMIVDLLRNDLSRVCRPESVCVTQLCQVETYSFVQHLVSSVEGELGPGQNVIDLLRGAFPGGSITGAPKVRAMEIIAELEPTARGSYCGCLGYLGLDGSMDLNILIRTVTASHGWWQIPVGGGIVAQSKPRQEYQETWDKAEGILRALDL